MSYDSFALSNFLLDYADERRSAISNLTLLKLLYFAHGWYLVEHDRPLLNETFEAWEHGPVIPTVYHQFSRYGSKPIKGRAHSLDPNTGEKVIVRYDFDKQLRAFLATIFDTYAPLGPFALSDMTHTPGSPWDVLRHNHSRSANMGMVIDNTLIRSHFFGVIQRSLI
jgi:uncharacterized phage-associated protein